MAKVADLFLTVDDLATRWKVHPATIRNWLPIGKAPKGIHINGAVRFPLKNVLQFENRCADKERKQENHS